MNMISMQEKVTYSTFRLRMKKFESNLTNSLARHLLKRQNFKSKQQEQNSMNLQLICIIYPQPEQFQVCIILHILRSNLKPSTWT